MYLAYMYVTIILNVALCNLREISRISRATTGCHQTGQCDSCHVILEV